MAAINVVAGKVRHLNGAIMRRYLAASTDVQVGSAVYVKSDGTIERADATDTLAESRARGVVVGIGVVGKTAAAVGDSCDVVVHGPVELGVGTNTEGAPVYVSTTAGKMDQTAPNSAGNFPFVVGYFESDTVLYVSPQVINPTAVGG